MQFGTRSGKTVEWIDLYFPLNETARTVLRDQGLSQVESAWGQWEIPHLEEGFGESATALLFSLDLTVGYQTERLLIVFNSDVLITLHSREIDWLQALEKKLSHKVLEDETPFLLFLSEILLGCIFSFEPVLDKIEKEIEQIEDRIFAGEKVPEVVEGIYHLKRKLSPLQRIHRATIDIIGKLIIHFEKSRRIFSHALNEAEASYQFSDRMSENLKQLINVQISLASHRTNEIVRLLTLFSVFFMPLTFVAGIYGMNFPNMPEIHWRYGYLSVLILMAVITAATFFWFRKKGWLK